ncbi:uncharacterized protein RSE6_06120 [Rhynchosporium secalis]|uniref:EF-hand domain-containing protein n=1 Tax=Rhynchosporium secalis TaxID=38038 RepID=A0A1E1M9N5_RHYSE|nr:uncharacterized protein RSE6_06120 [Rhynchosporium secalis]
MVFKESGIVVPLPPGFSKKPAPALPPRPKSHFDDDPSNSTKAKGAVKEKDKEPELGASNWGTLWNIMKAPLEMKGKKSRRGSAGADGNLEVPEMGDVTGAPENAANDETVASGETAVLATPRKPVRRGIERVDSTAATVPSYPQPEKWEALFDGDSTPTPIFVALMSTIFNHLDTDHTGFLSPETYSDFLDTQGCEENIWKQALERAEGEHSKELADLELSLYFADLLISHVLKFRLRTPSASPNAEPQSAVRRKIRNSLQFDANMPMISRQGFIDVCKVEYMKDPDMGHEYLGRVIKEYGIWKELGDVPREVLPEKSDSKLLGEITRETNAKSLGVKQEASTRERKDPETDKSHAADSTHVSDPETSQEMDFEDSSSLRFDENKSAHILSHIEIEHLVSPMALGSPALPFKLKGGESKITAIANGQDFDPSQEKPHDSIEDEIWDEKISLEANLINEKAEAEIVDVEKPKDNANGAKTPSLEDLYSPN